MKLKETVAVIIGAGSGIGRASAVEFAREGARVVVADINAGGARETVRQIEEAGGEALAVETDVSDPKAVERMTAATIERFSTIDVLLNNDGIRVNCICPGYIDAGLAEGYSQAQADPARARAEAGKLHALGRIGRAQEVGRAAVFLATADASFMTGSSLVVDGGFGSGLPGI